MAISHTNGNGTYSVGVFALELEEGGTNYPIGFVASIDGGNFKSTAVKQNIGADPYTYQFAGAPMYDDITIAVGMATAPPFWKWIKHSLDRKPTRRSGALVAYDFKRQEKMRRTFSNAVLSEVTFPALDASSKSSAQLTVKLSPESISFKNGTNQKADQASYAQNEVKKQKLWLTSNFGFELDRFKGDQSLRSAKIDAFTIKQNVIVRHIGAFPEALKEPGRVEFPNLVVTFPASQAEQWFKWWDETVARGHHHIQTSGAIIYLGANPQKTELMRLTLDGVGLLSLEADKMETGKEAMAKIKATMYVTSMKLETGEGTTSG